MKKTTIAAAILAFCSGAACAQSSVTVYGVLDAGLTHETGGAAGSVTKVSTGVQSGNRIGFKGVEDLGNGLKANFQIENGFDLDTGKQRQDALFGRQAFVGLSGDFGSLRIGRMCNPIFMSLDGIDPFETGLTGSTTNLMSIGNARTNNAIMYSSPNMAGLSTHIMYGAGETPGDSALGRAIGLSADYSVGALALTVAYDRVNVSPFNVNKLVLVGGTYKMGDVTLHAGVETEKNDAGADYRDIMLGLSLQIGQGKLLASAIDKNHRGNAELGGRQLAVGYTYALSKRSNLYSSYGHIRNDLNGTNFVGDASSGGSVPVAGHNSAALSVGMRHAF